MFVTGSAGSFVAGGTVSFMFGNAVGLVVFDSFGSGGTGNLHLSVLCISCLSVWNILLNLFLMVTVPVLLYIFTNRAIWCPSTFHCLLDFGSMGGCHFLGLWLYLYGEIWSRSRRDWPVLPQFKQVTWPCPCSGPWSASMGWNIFEQWGVATWCASLGRVFFLWVYCDIGSYFRWICGYIASLGGGFQLWPLLTPYTSLWGWVFFSSVTFVSFCTRGLVLGWAGLDWFCWG